MERVVRKGEVSFTIGDEKEDNFPNASKLSEKYGLTEKKQLVSTDNNSNNRANQEVAHQLEQYKRKIEDKNRKIENLCVLLEALEPVPGVDPEKVKKVIEGNEDGIDFRDSKIVALAKKSHNLTMLLNKERAIVENQNQEISDLKNLTASLNQQLKSALSKGGSKSQNLDSDDQSKLVSQLTRDLKESSKTTDELKRKLTQVTDENKNLTRVLTKELGEGITIDQAVNDGWKGRAQQIIMLKSKIKRLENDLNNNNGNNGGAVSRRNNQNDVDSNAEKLINDMSSERRQVVEELTEERFRLIEANQQLEKKVSAQKARVTVLENETKKMKENMQIILDKSNSDDELLDALRNEITKLRQNQVKISANNNLKVNEDEKFKSLQDNFSYQLQQYQTEIQRLQRLCKNQADQIDSQDTTIRQLKKKFNIST